MEELGQVGRVLGTVAHPDWAPKVTQLEITRHIARLASLEPKYRAALTGSGKVRFPEVKDARAEGQSRMLQVVAMILGLHPSDSPADIAARAGLLGPIFVQNEAIRAYLRARRTIEDVNPETGEVEPIESPAPAEGAPAEGTPAEGTPAEGTPA